jgi:DedD protein
VQVGAYLNASDVAEARQKVEKLGFKTFTQVVDSSTGRRTRVRIGPFNSREEAERTAERLKGTGLPVAVLVL